MMRRNRGDCESHIRDGESPLLKFRNRRPTNFRRFQHREAVSACLKTLLSPLRNQPMNFTTPYAVGCRRPPLRVSPDKPPQPRKSSLAAPTAVGDTIEPTQTMVDGREHTSKAGIRATSHAGHTFRAQAARDHLLHRDGHAGIGDEVLGGIKELNGSVNNPRPH